MWDSEIVIMLWVSVPCYQNYNQYAIWSSAQNVSITSYLFGIYKAFIKCVYFAKYIAFKEHDNWANVKHVLVQELLLMFGIGHNFDLILGTSGYLYYIIKL